MNKVERTFEYIKDKIAKGAWATGVKIPSEHELSKELGVSRATIRSAISKLATMEILIKKQGDGTYVNSTKPEMFFNELLPNLVLNQYSSVDILEFREIIEPECIKLFIENYDENEIKNLKKYYRIMKENELSRESHEYALADLQFHMTIARGSKNSIVIKIMEILNDILASYQLEANKQIGPRTGTQEHSGIIDAIEAKDVELASLLMKRHIQRSKTDILGSVNS